MRVALVTGGGSGIGRSAALELNKIDFTVYVVGRREEELIKTSSLATNINHKIIGISSYQDVNFVNRWIRINS